MPCKVTKIFFHNIAFIIHKLKLISPQKIIRGGAQYENKCTCIQCNKKKTKKTLVEICFLLNADFY